MSVREFAAHLGVSDRMVSKWEAAGESIHPRPMNQAALDTSLAQCTPEAQARFTASLDGLTPIPTQTAVGSEHTMCATRRTGS
jgi:hypothetical protein